MLNMSMDAGTRAGSEPDRSRASPRTRVRAGQLLPGVDGRSAWTRKAASQIRAYLTDLGGIENCSTAERSIVRRVATLEVELERLEERFATAGEASVEDLETYQRCANSQRRLLEAIGIERRAREVGPSFGVIEQEVAE
jgi:hypothetical protein